MKLHYWFIQSMVLVMSLGGALSAQAQLFADISIKTIPKYPKVGDTVTVRLDSSDVNLEFQNITWYVNGAKKVSGVAQTTTLVTIDRKIPRYDIRAVIGNSSGEITREIVITPGEIVLLWEAVDSFRPAWFMGKPLMPVEGLVRITAIPVGSKTLDGLFFVWKQNGASLASQSGYAKNSVVLRNNILLDTLEVEVQASSASGDYQASGSVIIPRSDSDIRLWSQDFGRPPRFERNGILYTNGEAATIQALPYGMSSRTGDRGLAYSWYLNNIAYTPPPDSRLDTINIARSSLPIQIQISVQSVDSITQGSTVEKRIVFE